MAVQLRLVVHRGKIIYDDIIVASSTVVRYADLSEEERFRTCNLLCLSLRKRGFNAYLISAYVVTLQESRVYRRAAIKALLEYLDLNTRGTHGPAILIKLRTPRKQFLDYVWNEKIMRMVLERREADYALSWLSTLGGAFSALGDEFQYCAEMAGKISARQLKLALRLGNPLLVARCQLYAALSMIQRGRVRTPKRLIKYLYRFAEDKKDVRLQNMCQGVWAKLWYCYHRRRRAKSSV